MQTLPLACLREPARAHQWVNLVAFGNLELGFVTGIGLCLVMFIIEYAREPTSRKVRQV